MAQVSGLSDNAIEVLEKRYLLKNDSQEVVENPDRLFKRVSSSIAQAEENFKSEFYPHEVEERFYKMMSGLEFLPNSPTLMNAGTPLGQLSACFVLPVEDSIDGIFKSLKDMAKIHQTGGGTGFSFSNLRPKGDLVCSTKGEASGPVSFMSIFDNATGVIIQGGRRRGANMGILRCDHPDILEFIEAKIAKDKFSNFNLSVGITNEFMDALKKSKIFNLINPRTGKVVNKVRAKIIFDSIVNAAWQTGDPGLVFLDEINGRNPTPKIGQIEATNPCGELPLLPHESCNLGSINLSRMMNGNKFDWEKLRNTIHLAVRFLDDVIEVNKFPLPEIKEITFANRKIGLGVMGFADMLIDMGISYSSPGAVKIAKKIMRFIHEESVKASILLAKERGVFPNYKDSIYAKKDLRLRNATVNTIAPTGTISIIAGCSSGIEPLFALNFVRNVLSGTKFTESNPAFEKIINEKGFDLKKILLEISKSSSLKKIRYIPKTIKKLFVTTFDISPSQHILIQSAFQQYTDNSVSKTINLPNDATVEDVRKIYLLAHKMRLKGITVYRYGSKEKQVFSYGSELKPSSKSCQRFSCC